MASPDSNPDSYFDGIHGPRNMYEAAFWVGPDADTNADPIDEQLAAAMRYFEEHPQTDEEFARRLADALINDIDDVLPRDAPDSGLLDGDEF